MNCCPSCLKPWRAHPGLIQVCEANAKLTEQVAKLTEQIKRMRAIANGKSEENLIKL